MVCGFDLTFLFFIETNHDGYDMRMRTLIPFIIRGVNKTFCTSHCHPQIQKSVVHAHKCLWTRHMPIWDHTGHGTPCVAYDGLGLSYDMLIRLGSGGLGSYFIWRSITSGTCADPDLFKPEDNRDSSARNCATAVEVNAYKYKSVYHKLDQVRIDETGR